MFYIQSGGGETGGMYLRGFAGASPVWTEEKQEAKSYSSVDDTASDERALEMHGHLCFVIPA